MATILIIDDDQALRESLAETLSDLGHEIAQAASGRQGLARLSEGGIDAVFLDLRMADGNGMEVLQSLRASPSAHPPLIMLTAHASSSNTIEAMKLGCFDHLTKPIGRADVLRVLDRALRQDVVTMPTEPVEEGLLGSCEAMRAVQKLIGMVAANDAAVLVTGETGTGKEMVARALHENSARAGHAFVAVNCAAIPHELLESELFGHVKGAFTGAQGDRLGRFSQAHGGTLLLDEIGDMNLGMQAKILRVLEERELTRVGSLRTEKVDVRVVAATHRDLPELVRAGGFRQDLFYRLNVVSIRLPPLRERGTDILMLADHFLHGLAPGKVLSSGARALLERQPWPGNVRELKNAIARAVITVRGGVIEPSDFDFLASDIRTPQEGKGDHLVAQSAATEPPRGDLPSAVAELERAMIVRVLEESGGNRAEAARRLKIHRQLLYAKMKEYGIA